MIDDPRVKLVLKRYPKDSDYFDATIDLSDLPISGIRQALQSSPEDLDVRPRLLDAHAVQYFSQYWPDAFDTTAFDYFVHLYRRKEVDSVSLPSEGAVLQIPHEDGPPAAIQRPQGTRWLSVRPSDDGFENYEAVDV